MAMGNEIPEQLAMFLRSVALGGVLGLVYDLARCLRRLGGPLWRGPAGRGGEPDGGGVPVLLHYGRQRGAAAVHSDRGSGSGVLFFSLLSPLLRPLWDFWLDLLLIPARLLGRIGKKLYRICKKLFFFSAKVVYNNSYTLAERLRPAGEGRGDGGGEKARQKGEKTLRRQAAAPDLPRPAAGGWHSAVQMQGQLEAARAEEAVYAQRLAELRETNERLATDIANSDDPELIEEIARDELGMVEQGEKIIRFNY